MELDSKIHGETTQLLWHLSGKSVPYKYCPILAYLYNPRSSFCPIDRIHNPHKDKPTYCAMKWLQPFSLFVGIFWSYLSHLCSANLEVIWLFPMESCQDTSAPSATSGRCARCASCGRNWAWLHLASGEGHGLWLDPLGWKRIRDKWQIKIKSNGWFVKSSLGVSLSHETIWVYRLCCIFFVCPSIFGHPNLQYTPLKVAYTPLKMIIPNRYAIWNLLVS